MPDIFNGRQQLPISLTSETEHELLKIVVEEVGEDIDRFIQDILDNGIFSGEHLEPRQRLLHYTMFTDQRDFPLIMNEDYIKQQKAGLAPNPVSPRWLAALSIPPIWDHMASDFRKLYKQYVGVPST